MTRTQLADPRTLRRAAAGRKMNRAEATALTAQIRSTAHGLWRLVAEAYDRKAWQALGYSGWKEYAEVELQMSESRSYQLVDTGRVMRAIGEVVGTEEVFETIVVTARETAKIKPHLSTFKKDVKDNIGAGMEPTEAVEMAIESLPAPTPRVVGARGSGKSAVTVIEGEIVTEGQDDSAALEAILTGGNRGSVITAAPAVAQPLFSNAAAATDTPMQVTRRNVPKGKKVCSTCDGHGYV